MSVSESSSRRELRVSPQNGAGKGAEGRGTAQPEEGGW